MLLLPLAPIVSFEATAQSPRPSVDAIAAEARVQQAYALQALFADVDRVERVSFPLLRAAAGYCGERRQWALGPAPRSVAQVPQALRDAAPDVGLDERLRFALVVAGTPLALAGVQPGDALLAVNGEAVPVGPSALAWFHQQVAQQWTLTRQPLQLRLQRANRTLALAATPLALCGTAVRYAIADAVNAAAGVNGLLVTSGMLRFAADDAELALVLSHELAHAVLRHPDTAARLSSRYYSQEKERDADRLGLYLSAAAGYDIGRAADLWRRMAVRAPGSIRDDFSASHPSSPERFLLMRATASEIAVRQRRGDNLLPPLAELALRPDAAGSSTDDKVVPQPLPALAQLPFLNDEGRAAYEAFVSTRERPRALALSLRGHVSMRSGADAAAEALASCNVLARGACRLVAQDDVWLGAGFLPPPTGAASAAAPPASAAAQ